MHNPQPAQHNAGETTIDLSRYYYLLRDNLRTIGVFVAMALLLGILYLHSATRVYTVTMQVTPVEASNNSLTTGLSGVASLAGINLPSSPGQRQLELYLSALSSPTVGAAILKNQELAHELFRSAWDDQAHAWRDKSGWLTPVKNTVKFALGFTVVPWSAPKPQDVMEIVEREVDVDYKPTSPIVTMTYKNKDPEFARKFLLALHLAADGDLRGRAMARATAYITYLNDELEHVTSNDQRQALINTLTNQEAQRMAAGANISYSVDVFSLPSASTKPTAPVAIATVMTAVLAGFAVGVIYVLIRNRRPRA